MQPLDMRSCAPASACACCALITCTFCPGEYVLFETALPPRGGGGICPRSRGRRPLLPRAAAMASLGLLPLPPLVGQSMPEYIAMQTPVPARSCMQFEPPEPRSKSNGMNISYDVVYNIACEVVCNVVCKNVQYAGQNIRCSIR